jgi:hypothetical protein
MLLYHRTSVEGDQLAMSSELMDLFPTALEAMTAQVEHRLFVTELAHPLDDPLTGTLVVDPDRITAAIYAEFQELWMMPDLHACPGFSSA